jgi:elongation factor Ts
MAISATQVKELRELTSAGMMDCKKALEETQGDFDKAVELLRKKGQAKAVNKAGRIAAEGIIISAHNNARAVLVEVNSETDFAAKNQDFLTFSENVANTVLQTNCSDVATLATTALAGGTQTVEEARQHLIGKIGENIQVRRIAIVPVTGPIGAYMHGSRIGVLVHLNGGDEALAKDLAMHVAASRPLTIRADEVDATLVAKEKEIFAAQAAESGKPADIIEKMVLGRISKFVDEVSLEGQPFVKDPNVKVGQLLKTKGATVTQFVRFEVGEGIEKKVEDFAASVMATAQGA